MKQLNFSLLKSYLPDKVFWYKDPRFDDLFTIAVKYKDGYLKMHILNKYLYLVQDWLPQKPNPNVSGSTNTQTRSFCVEALNAQLQLNDMWLKVLEDLNDNNMEK